MKIQIINIVEVDRFVEYVKSWVLDRNKKEVLEKLGIKASVSKREILIAMGIEPNYYGNVRADKTDFSPKVSERIINFAKKLDYEFET